MGGRRGRSLGTQPHGGVVRQQTCVERCARQQDVLVGGQLVETQTLPSVTFYGDGTCSPFRAQLRNKGVDPRVLEIDPWTCAQVLPNAEDKR